MTNRNLAELVVPDFDLGNQPLTISAWLVRRGAEVTEGDRMVEILAGDVTVDLSAPASGRLVEVAAGIDDVVRVGQILARIEVLDDDD